MAQRRRLYLLPSETAQFLGVTIRTVQRMVRDGRLEADYGGRGGTQRFLYSKVRDLKAGANKGTRRVPAGVKHGLYAYTHYNCRCGICRLARSNYIADRKDEQVLAPDDPRHGKRSTYTTLGCRCERCKKANRDYSSERRRDREFDQL
jgi:hypothetical protein